MSGYSKDDTIFVQIASYRDPELQHTLQDLFKKAKRPENITVGICHQYDMKGDEDKHLFEVPFPNPKQLRIDEVDYRDTKGCSWARSRVQTLYKDEKWTLQIDSHINFEKNWDQGFVEMAKDLQNKGYNKPVITHYPPDYVPQNLHYYNTKQEIKLSELVGMQPIFKGGHDNGNIILLQYSFLKKKYEFPINAAFIADGFLFSLSSIIKDVPIDEKLYFSGQEIITSVRLWTNGYDIFCPNKVLGYHFCENKKDEIGNIEKEHNKHQLDNHYVSLNQISFTRIKHIINTEKTNKIESLNGVDSYSLGNERSLKDYERFAGVNFRKRKIREYSSHGIFEKWKEVANISYIKSIYNSN